MRQVAAANTQTNVVSSVGYCTEEWFPFPLGCLQRVIMNGDY